MKFTVFAAFVSLASAGTPPTVGLGHAYVPAKQRGL